MNGNTPRRLACFLFLVTLTTSTAVRAQPHRRIECPDDVTIALQQAINDFSAGGAYAGIQFTEGTCEIHETIEVCNIEGLRIEGAGPGGTILQWLPSDPADEGPMFSLQNSAGIAFSDFSVCLGGTVANVVTLDSAFDSYNACFDCTHDSVDRCDPSTHVWGSASDMSYYPGGLPHSHANSFTNIKIASCVGEWGVLNHGARIKLYGERDQLVDTDIATGCSPDPAEADAHGDDNGTTTQQELEDYYAHIYGTADWNRHLRADCYNEHHSFTDMSVSEFRESAFVIEGRNSYGNTFTNVHCDGLFQEETPGALNAVGSGRICVETGQNRWVPEGGTGSLVHAHVHVGGTTESGAALGHSTQGNFFWYGGTAKNLSEAVFVLGCASSPIHIVGLDAKHSRALLKALSPDVARSELPLLIESVQFDTDGVHTWDRTRSFFARNPYGIVVDYPYHGPLIVRDSVFGECPAEDAAGDSGPQNVSVYWNYESPGNPGEVYGSFIFQSNAFSTRQEDPFVPISSVTELPYQYPDPIGVYPTTQEANLVCTRTDESSPWQWTPMPQHFTEITLDPLANMPGSPLEYDLGQLSTSKNYFILSGDGYLSDFTSGVVGQELVLIGGENSSATVVHTAGQIELRQAGFLASGEYEMTEGHTLWLVYDPDGCWREIGRGENQF